MKSKKPLEKLLGVTLRKAPVLRASLDLWEVDEDTAEELIPEDRKGQFKKAMDRINRIKPKEKENNGKLSLACDRLAQTYRIFLSGQFDLIDHATAHASGQRRPAEFHKFSLISDDTPLPDPRGVAAVFDKPTMTRTADDVLALMRIQADAIKELAEEGKAEELVDAIVTKQNLLFDGAKKYCQDNYLDTVMPDQKGAGRRKA